MSTSRGGGLLFSAGLALLLAAGAIVIARGAAGIDRDLIPLILVALGQLGVGALVLRLKGPKPLRGRLVKLGLASLATGFLVLASAGLLGGSLRGTDVDVLLVPLVCGLGAVALGALAIGLALARLRGPWEWPGLMLLAGMALVLLGTWGATASLLGAMAQAVTAAGGLIVVLGALGIGFLASVGAGPK